MYSRRPFLDDYAERVLHGKSERPPVQWRRFGKRDLLDGGEIIGGEFEIERTDNGDHDANGLEIRQVLSKAKTRTTVEGVEFEG